MRDQWRAEEDARHRPEFRHRTADKFDRRSRSPPPVRREHSEDRYRGRDLAGTESYRPSQDRERPRDSKRRIHRRLSPSPAPGRQPKSKEAEPKGGRPLAERITDPRDQPPVHSHKKRRTHSPSPTRTGRYNPSPRRQSRSTDRLDRRDRRVAATDRPSSPRRTSPLRPSRPDRGVDNPKLDTYVPLRRKRDRSRSPPPRHRRRHSRSPRRESSPRPSRRDRQRNVPRQTHHSRSPIRRKALSPHNESKHRNKMHSTQKIPSIMDDTNRPSSPSRPGSHYQHSNHDAMDGRPSMRGGYSHNNMMQHNRSTRPSPADSRQPYAGSPGFVTPNSSYHGSPQSGSPFGSNRGGWGGQQQFHGHQG